jgi:hypothetical protein
MFSMLSVEVYMSDQQPQTWADGPGAGIFQQTETKNQKLINQRARGGDEEEHVHQYFPSKCFLSIDFRCPPFLN